MKKFSLILPLLAFSLFSCSGEDTIQDTSASSAAARSGITGGSVTLGIGRNSRNCGGFGICRIVKASVTIDNHYTITYTNPEARTMQTNYQSVDPNSFYLLVDRSIYGDLVRVEGGEKFIIEESFTFDRETTTIMGLADNFTVAPNAIPIIWDNADGIYKILIKNAR